MKNYFLNAGNVLLLFLLLILLFLGGKFLDDKITLGTVEFKDQKQLYLKDLGPQIGWKTVSLYMCAFIYVAYNRI